MPTTDEFQHQFLGLVSPKLPNGAPNPAYDDVFLDGDADNRVSAARGVHPDGLRGGGRGPDARPQARRPRTRRRSSRPTTASRRSSSRSTPASRWSTSACSSAAADLELPLRPTGRDPDQANAEGLLGRRRAADLPQRRPGPRSAASKPAGAATELMQIRARPTRSTPRSRQIKATFLALTDPNDWTHDGQPDKLKMIDRAFTKAEARYIPIGPRQTADMAHPTRTGDLVVFAVPAVPVRRRDAGHARRALALLRPARLRAGRPEPRRQHQHAGDVPRRRRPASPRAGQGPLDRPRPDARVHPRDPRAAAQPGQGAARRRQAAATATSRSRSSG